VLRQIIDKMEAAGLVEKIELPKQLRFNFEGVRKMPPPIIAFNDVAFSYSGKMEDALYKDLDFGIECVAAPASPSSFPTLLADSIVTQYGFSRCNCRPKWYR
jgi:hypothetical protein